MRVPATSSASTTASSARLRIRFICSTSLRSVVACKLTRFPSGGVPPVPSSSHVEFHLRRARGFSFPWKSWCRWAFSGSQRPRWRPVPASCAALSACGIIRLVLPEARRTQKSSHGCGGEGPVDAQPNGQPDRTRRRTVTVNVGGVPIGGDHPIVIQSMTNPDTADVDATVRQIQELADAGSEIVRITVNNEDAARAVPHIVERLRDAGYTTPIVGDFHY
ncbi:MAG: hypothetical protein DIU82_10740, partial [Bacillota bacterium]